MDPDQTAPDLGPHCLQTGLKITSRLTKQTTVVVIGSVRVNMGKLQTIFGVSEIQF